jgi:type I restriction enzyme S subunit
MIHTSYPEYRESEVEWLDKVPSHWCNVPIKYMALDKESLFLDGDWIESKDISGDEIRYITTGNVGVGYYKEQGLGFISEEKFKQLDCTEVFEGDILISRLNAPIGRSCIVPNLDARIVTSVDNVIFRPDEKYHGKFIVHLFSSSDYFKNTSNLARGATMQRISRGLLGNIRVVAPPYAEQEKIASFLDHETAKIDTLIEKQQQLIALLKEKRQAVISHAVTKGLNANAPMRDSGVEWLGEVPEHWVVIRLSRVGKVSQGCAFSHSIQGQEAGELPWFKCMDMNTVGNEELMNNAANYVDYYLAERIDARVFPSGTVIFPRVGAALLTNKRRILTCPSVVDDNIYTFIPEKAKAHSRFIYLFLRLIDMATICSPGLVPTITFGAVNDIRFPKPSLPEQQEIVEYVERQTSTMESLIQKAEFAIDLMQERRTALISAAVTGKIDVRDWVAPEEN